MRLFATPYDGVAAGGGWLIGYQRSVADDRPSRRNGDLELRRGQVVWRRPAHGLRGEALGAESDPRRFLCRRCCPAEEAALDVEIEPMDVAPVAGAEIDLQAAT